MKPDFKAGIGAILVVLIGSTALADSRKIADLQSPLCPENVGWLSWKTFFHLSGATKNRAFLHLTESAKMPDSKTWKNGCYDVRYHFTSITEPRRWEVRGKFDDMPANAAGGADVLTHHTGQVDFNYTAVVDDPRGGGTIGVRETIKENGKFGDPNQYEMSIRGEILVFNEAGEVYHREYGKIGTLDCFFYAGTTSPCVGGY